MTERLEKQRIELTSTKNIRESAHKIVDRYSDSILSIDDNTLQKDLISTLQKFKESSKDEGGHLVDTPLSSENELGLTLFLDVVNFCYRNPYSKNDYVYKNKEGKSISRATGLKAAMSESGINWGSTKEVAAMTNEKWAKAVQLDTNKDFYLGVDRGKRIAEFAGKLNNSGFKNISHFLVFGEYDTRIILPVLANSGYFDDEFQKRSQLAINMMDGVLKRRFDREFKNTTDLTVMADYRLPQVMYNFGAIKLSEVLREKLLKQEIIDTGSPVELSLRAASIVIGEKIAKKMRITEGEVDTLLWTLSQKMAKANQLVIPHMLVATDKY